MRTREMMFGKVLYNSKAYIIFPIAPNRSYRSPSNPFESFTNMQYTSPRMKVICFVFTKQRTHHIHTHSHTNRYETSNTTKTDRRKSQIHGRGRSTAAQGRARYWDAARCHCPCCVSFNGRADHVYHTTPYSPLPSPPKRLEESGGATVYF